MKNQVFQRLSNQTTTQQLQPVQRPEVKPKVEFGTIQISAVLVIILAAITAYVSKILWDRRQGRKAFRHAFADSILNITENPTCTLAMIAHNCHNGILAAISNYRPYVPLWRRKAFERAVAKYKEAYDITLEHGDPFAFALSENTDHARVKRKYYHDVINQLISFA